MLRYVLLGFVLCLGCASQQSNSTGADQPQPEPQAGKSGSGESKGPGVMQPKWTMIEGVKDCTGQILTNYVCTPPERPAQCAEKAWQELTALTGDDAVTPCALEPDIMDCTTAAADDASTRCFPAQRPASCPDDKWGRVKDVKLVYACK